MVTYGAERLGPSHVPADQHSSLAVVSVECNVVLVLSRGEIILQGSHRDQPNATAELAKAARLTFSGHHRFR